MYTMYKKKKTKFFRASNYATSWRVFEIYIVIRFKRDPFFIFEYNT